MANKSTKNGGSGKAQSSAVKETKMAETATATAATPVNLDGNDERIPASFRPLVASGALLARIDRVKVEVKGKPEPATREYVRLTAATMEGALALTDGRLNAVTEGDNKGNGVLDYFNYGFDLGVRSNERNKLLATLEGPEAGVRRAIKGLIAAGMTEAIAVQAAIGALKASGNLPADYVLPEGFSLTSK